MKTLILVGGAMCLFAGSAMAQTHMVAGGVDTRVPALESQYLSQETGALAQQVARAAAMLAVEKQDDAATTKALADVTAYWKAWCGTNAGCATPSSPKVK